MTDGSRVEQAQSTPMPVAAAPLVGRLTGRPPVPLTLETLLDDHAIQRLLCDELEAVADRLPGLPPPDAIRRLCDRILWITETHFVRAEAILGNLPASGRGLSPAALASLCRMHRLDEMHAQDLVAALWRYAAGRDEPASRGFSGSSTGGGVGQLAYMLRCFFDGGRRALALKESWLADGRALVDASPDARD